MKGGEERTEREEEGRGEGGKGPRDRGRKGGTMRKRKAKKE
jgi:hypothetical protein